MTALFDTRLTRKNGASTGLALTALAVALVGCGSSSPESVASAVSGTALSSAPMNATISLKDSSAQARERTTTTDKTGSFSLNVTGLTPPFILKAESTDGSGTTRMYSVAPQAGTASINPLTNAAVTAAAEAEGEGDAYVAPPSQTASSYEAIRAQLRTVLAPLFQHYGITFADDWEESSAFRTMLSEVSFVVNAGVLTVANNATGAVIFSAPLNNLASGTFSAGNMPGTTPPPSSACVFTYSAWGACQPDGTETRTVLSSSPTGCTSGTPVLSQACTYVPPVTACSSFTYSAWGACQPDGTETRTVLSSSPTGCTGGTPVLSQACSYTAPNPVTLANVTASCTGCHGLTANSTVIAPGGYTVTGRTAANWLTTVNAMVGFGATLAPGTTAQDYANFLAGLP